METLQQGSRGKLVEFLQALLNGEYYVNGVGEELNEDGIFGPRTAAQLRSFIDGTMRVSMPLIVNDAVWRALGVDHWVTHATTMVSQHTDMLCWNAAAAMTLGVQQSMVTGGATLTTGAPTRPGGSVRGAGGLEVNNANIRQFLTAVRLNPRAPPSDGAALDMLVRRSRVWLAGAVSGGAGGATHHAVCITGCVGTRPMPDRSTRFLVRIHDPWPPSASGGADGGTIRWNYYYLPQMYLGRMLFTPMFAATP
jgi:hypothetical protein